MKVKNVRLIVGILLIAVSVSTFIFWEVKGRELVFREDLVVAVKDIRSGEELTRENLGVVSIDDDDVIAGAVAGEAIDALVGKTARQYIPQGAQLNKAFVAEEGDLVISGDESIFAIKGKMIDMVSSSLRRGDRVKIYGNSGKEELGEFTVAFVKDSSDREVKNLESLKNDEPVDREDSNYKISSVEIICTSQEYAKIIDYVTVSDSGLTIVQVF
ncbi:MAG: hypothetical protein IKV96_02960 [Firmicutes bacterium]|nr:hypothetical protein [Bacillota bacterium]